MLRFLDGIAKELDVGTGFGSTRVGVVVYGNKALVEISLTDIDNMPDLHAAIAGIDYLPNEGSNTSDGILLMMQQFQKHNRGYFAREIAVLLAHGLSTIDSEDTIASAVLAKNKGITIFAIGVTDNIHHEELRQISSDPQLIGVNFFISPTFDGLDYILANVEAQMKLGKLYESTSGNGSFVLHFHKEWSIHIRCRDAGWGGVIRVTRTHLIEPDEFHPDSTKGVFNYLCSASYSPLLPVYCPGSMVGPNQGMHYSGGFRGGVTGVLTRPPDSCQEKT